MSHGAREETQCKVEVRDSSSPRRVFDRMGVAPALDGRTGARDL